MSLFRCRSISSTNPGQISNLTTQSLHLMCLVQIMTAEDKGILGVGWPCHQFCPLSVFCKSELLQRCISAAMAPSSCVDNRLRGTKIMTQIIYEIFFLLSMFIHGQKIFLQHIFFLLSLFPKLIGTSKLRRQFYSKPPNILLVGILVGWPSYLPPKSFVLVHYKTSI